MLLRLAKAMWWVSKSQTKVGFSESTLEKSQGDPWGDDGNAMDSYTTTCQRGQLC